MPSIALVRLLLLAPACFAAAEEERTPESWLQWRGPTRDGQVTGAAWPDGLGADRVRLLWRVADLGASYSGPIVSGARVFTVATFEEREERALAFDRASGKLLWSASWEGALRVPFFAASRGSWMRATPSCDGETLFVAGMRDVLVALDVETGAERWRADLASRHESPLPTFGCVSSPLVEGERIYVQAGGGLLALDKRSGETLWRSLVDGGGMNGSAFSSPCLATLDGVEQLLVQTRTELAGVRPEDGAVLWRIEVPAYRGMNIVTPLLHDGGVLTSSYGGTTLLFGVERAEGSWSARERWSNRRQGYMTSPVRVANHAYLFLRSNRFGCFDLSTGEDAWISEPTGDEYWSVVAQGDRLLALANTGMLRLVAARPDTYEVLGEVELIDGQSWAHLAVADDELFVRELDALSVFEWK